MKPSPTNGGYREHRDHNPAAFDRAAINTELEALATQLQADET